VFVPREVCYSGCLMLDTMGSLNSDQETTMNESIPKNKGNKRGRGVGFISKPISRKGVARTKKIKQMKCGLEGLET